jgi:WD40 repeat protein
VFCSVVQIQPNSLLGVLGEHEDECPIEQLALSRDKLFVASCSHDQTVKFWSATDLFEVCFDFSYFSFSIDFQSTYFITGRWY